MKEQFRPFIFLVLLCLVVLTFQGATQQLFKDRDSYETLALRAELQTAMAKEEATLYAKASAAQKAEIEKQLAGIEDIFEDYKQSIYSLWTESLSQYRSLPSNERQAHRLLEYQLETKKAVILENNKSDARFLPAVRELRYYLSDNDLPIHICNTIESAYEAEKQWMLQIDMPIWEE